MGIVASPARRAAAAADFADLPNRAGLAFGVVPFAAREAFGAFDFLADFSALVPFRPARASRSARRLRAAGSSACSSRRGWASSASPSPANSASNPLGASRWSPSAFSPRAPRARRISSSTGDAPGCSAEGTAEAERRPVGRAACSASGNSVRCGRAAVAPRRRRAGRAGSGSAEVGKLDAGSGRCGSGKATVDAGVAGAWSAGSENISCGLDALGAWGDAGASGIGCAAASGFPKRASNDGRCATGMEVAAGVA